MTKKEMRENAGTTVIGIFILVAFSMILWSPAAQAYTLQGPVESGSSWAYARLDYYNYPGYAYEEAYKVNTYEFSFSSDYGTPPEYVDPLEVALDFTYWVQAQRQYTSTPGSVAASAHAELYYYDEGTPTVIQTWHDDAVETIDPNIMDSISYSTTFEARVGISYFVTFDLYAMTHLTGSPGWLESQARVYVSPQITILSEETAPVPEPTTMLHLRSCIIGLAGFRRKLKKR